MRLAAIGAALALSLLAPVALAQPEPSSPAGQQPAEVVGQADVLVLHATNEGKGISDKIRKLPYQLPELEKPPLSAYDTYELVDNKQLPLSTTEGQKLTLPGESVLAVDLVEVLAPTKEQPKARYGLKTSITKPNGKQLTSVKVTAEPKVFFFVAGPAHKNGILVIGIRVLPKP